MVAAAGVSAAPTSENDPFLVPKIADPWLRLAPYLDVVNGFARRDAVNLGNRY